MNEYPITERQMARIKEAAMALESALLDVQGQDFEVSFGPAFRTEGESPVRVGRRRLTVVAKDLILA